eukprot:GFYU01006870.1.p1 GENE.GFYU01006870.1~~GFYU01006870.1.p1  ORF type:complete len:551 (-),score=106.86 GFYU01006870.1:173-1825(-)
MVRLPQLDLLRVMSTVVVIMFHVNRFFDRHPHHLKFKDDLPVDMDDGTLSNTRDFFEDLSRFVTAWNMPLFFLLAGWSFHLSCNSRQGKFWDIVSERVYRLLVPFVTGLVFVVYPSDYLRRCNRLPGTFMESFFSWQNLTQHAASFWFGGALTIHHLWFLPFLFCITVLQLPICLYITKSNADTAPLEDPVSPTVTTPLRLRRSISSDRELWPASASGGPGGSGSAALSALRLTFASPLALVLSFGLVTCFVVLGAEAGAPWSVLLALPMQHLGLLLLGHHPLRKVAMLVITNVYAVSSVTEEELTAMSGFAAFFYVIIYYNAFYLCGYFCFEVSRHQFVLISELSAIAGWGDSPETGRDGSSNVKFRQSISSLVLMLLVPFVSLLFPRQGSEAGYTIPLWILHTYTPVTSRVSYHLGAWVWVSILLFVAGQLLPTNLRGAPSPSFSSLNSDGTQTQNPDDVAPANAASRQDSINRDELYRLNSIAFPMYIIHILPCYFCAIVIPRIVTLSLPVGWIVVQLSTLALTYVSVRFTIRRFYVSRFLMGLKKL